MRTSKFFNILNSNKITIPLSGRIFLGLALGASLGAFGLAGCHSNPANTTNPADGTTASTDPNATDPTAANMAPVDNSTQVAGIQQEGQQTQQGYANPAPAAAPIVRRKPSSGSSGESSTAQNYSDPSYTQGTNSSPTYNSDQGYNSNQSSNSNQGYNNDQDYNAEQGYSATLSDLQATQPPPALPEYAQPPAPDPGYIWTPGYWSYSSQGYYWVPGAWTQPPYTGALWTPGYWGGYDNGYRFHHGFWAAHIGFYGGINYGFGYVGTGYQGGYWDGPHFHYNQYANNINININPGFREAVYQRNVTSINNTVINNRVVNNTTYNNTTINNTRINNVSYNGGRGGVAVQPRPAELAVLREKRTPPMQAQVQVAKVSAGNPQQFYAHNQGKPVELAAARPLVADRGIAPPAHTTAEINRSAPPQEQLRQHQEAFKASQPQQQPQVRTATPAPLPNRMTPNQAQVPQHPVQQQNTLQAARPGQPVNRPAQTQPQHTAPQQVPHPQPQPQQQVHPQPQQQVHPPAQQQVHPPAQQAKPQTVQPAARPAPTPAPTRAPQQVARPQPQQQTPHPQPQQQSHPQPQAHPQTPQAHPPQAAHPQAQQARQEPKKPEPHR